MKPRAILLGVMTTALLLPTASLGDSFRVRATEDDTWRPAVREIHRGDKVTWRNPTDDVHTVVAYRANSRPWDKNATLLPGTKTSKTFRRKGVYKYYCDKHGHVDRSTGDCHGMCGRIRVRGGG